MWLQAYSSVFPLKNGKTKHVEAAQASMFLHMLRSSVCMLFSPPTFWSKRKDDIWCWNHIFNLLLPNVTDYLDAEFLEVVNFNPYTKKKKDSPPQHFKYDHSRESGTERFLVVYFSYPTANKPRLALSLSRRCRLICPGHFLLSATGTVFGPCGLYPVTACIVQVQERTP